MAVKTAEQKFWDKIAVAQTLMAPPKKQNTNPAFKSKYASLGSTLDEIDPVLIEQKLAHAFLFNGSDLVYRVWDLESDSWVHSSITLPMDGLSGNVWQQIGQGLTYLRRYLAQAFWNMVPEDDDGNSAPARKAPEQSAAQQAVGSGEAQPNGLPVGGGSL